MAAGGVKIDIIGNKYKIGPNNREQYNWEVWIRTDGSPGDDKSLGPRGNPSIYIKGNIGPHQSNPNGDNWGMMTECKAWSSLGHPPTRAWERLEPITRTYPITVHSVLELENLLLPNVGASHRLDENGHWVPNRDSVDLRLLRQYEDGTGIIPRTENDVGGYPTIALGTPYADSDHDGMADEWENNHFGNLSRGSPNDSSSDYDGDGYTDLEEFLNGTNPTGGIAPASTPTLSSNPYDLDGDGQVNAADTFILLQNWINGSQGDFNSDGLVNSFDFGLLIVNWDATE